MRKTVSLGWLLVVGAAGCAVDDVEVDGGLEEVGGDDEDGEVEFRSCTAGPCRGAATGWGCDHCGYQNSPEVGGHAASDFAIGAGYGFRLSGIEDTLGVRHPVEVLANGELQVTIGSKKYKGQQLVDWKLIFLGYSYEWPVTIFAYSEQYSWTDCTTRIPTYGFAPMHDKFHNDVPLYNICPGISMDGTSVVLTPHETYDQASKTVNNDWSRVAVSCRAHAGMKMKFIGYTRDKMPGGANADDHLSERRAAFKMLTADYCGDGTGTYTVAGTPLVWDDTPTNNDFHVCPGDLVESYWTEGGALCLSKPRWVSDASKVKCWNDDAPPQLERLPYCEDLADPTDPAEWGQLAPIMSAIP